MLGKEPEVEGNACEDIQPVFEDLGIRADPFDMDEYQAVKKKLTLRKSAGPDGIPPDVLKNCVILMISYYQLQKDSSMVTNQINGQ